MSQAGSGPASQARLAAYGLQRIELGCVDVGGVGGGGGEAAHYQALDEDGPADGDGPARAVEEVERQRFLAAVLVREGGSLGCM